MTGPRQTVVVVEDEEPVLLVTVRLLHRAGYDVVPFQHPFQARDYLNRGGPPPALLIIDVMLPGMSGFDLCHAARQHYPILPVIFTSGYPLDSLPEGFHQLPAISCLLSKPYGLAELASAVEDLLAGRGLPDAPEPPSDSDEAERRRHSV